LHPGDSAAHNQYGSDDILRHGLILLIKIEPCSLADNIIYYKYDFFQTLVCLHSEKGINKKSKLFSYRLTIRLSTDFEVC